MLDPEKHALYRVMTWALQHHHYVQVCQLARGVRYYYYVRGFWDKRLMIDQMHAEAARLMGDPIEEVKALAYYVQIVARQHQSGEATRYLSRLQDFVVQPAAPDGVRSICQQALALEAMAHGAFARAASLWHHSERPSDPRVNVAARRWRALCLHELGQIEQARQLFEESLQEAIVYHFERSIALHYLKVAMIDLAQDDMDAAQAALAESWKRVTRYGFSGDIAEAQYVTARYHLKRGDHGSARPLLHEAIDRFKRMSLHRELSEALHLLAEVEL